MTELEKELESIHYPEDHIQNKDHLAELFNLWHLAQAACPDSRYSRALQAVKWFIEKYPKYSSNKVYLQLTNEV